MQFDIWMIYVATVLALMSTPGPSQLLMLSNAMSHGFCRSLATATGDLSANALQMLAAGLGLAAILAASGQALGIIKWFGVAYLIWLGIRMIRKAGPSRPLDKVIQMNIPPSGRVQPTPPGMCRTRLPPPRPPPSGSASAYADRRPVSPAPVAK